ncbi:MAG: hypothetical protein EOP04_09730 [Proteobacteria bacterium]|nr:MAG: hypothetical protein EOP04_09730 [Pseudomonadota bacterium]
MDTAFTSREQISESDNEGDGALVQSCRALSGFEFNPISSVVDEVATIYSKDLCTPGQTMVDPIDGQTAYELGIDVVQSQTNMDGSFNVLIVVCEGSIRQHVDLYETSP